ncbi:MAG: hypothetical protein ACKOYJ_01355 [Planctomycetia bacterium]
MKRSCGLLLAMLVMSLASGCSIIDRLFLLNTDGPHGHHAQHGNCEDGACEMDACGPGGCRTGGCGPDGCNECADGTCRPRHVGRYGGLAKHHLSPEERAALNASDYGATTPAGPPSGAVAYPYYTTRGPRDFLAKCPPSIGP